MRMNKMQMHYHVEMIIIRTVDSKKNGILFKLFAISKLFAFYICKL